MNKKIISLVLTCVMLISMATPAFAYETNMEANKIVSPRFTYISVASANLSVSSSNMASVSVDLTGNSEVTKTKATVRLQKKSGNGWTTVKTWNTSSERVVPTW